MEIERKFLCSKTPSNLKNFKCHQITQGYICSEPTIRIRKLDDSHFLTIKSKGEVSREELELEISQIEYNNLCEKVEHNFVNKYRYLIPIENNLVAELDIYLDELKGLITIEVEFDSIEECNEFIPPDWFGEDISYKNEYKNVNLAKGSTKVANATL